MLGKVLALLGGGLALFATLALARRSSAQAGILASTPTSMQVKGKSGKVWLLSKASVPAVLAGVKWQDTWDLWTGPGQYTGIDTFLPVLQFAKIPAKAATAGSPSLDYNVLTMKYPAAATVAYADAVADFQILELGVSQLAQATKGTTVIA